MATPTKDNSPDVCIIHAEDTIEWARHFENSFSSTNTSCVLYTEAEVMPIPKAEVQKFLDKSKAILIILSSGMMDHLLEFKGNNFESVVRDLNKGILFYISVSEEEMKPYRLQDRFPNYYDDKWTKLSYGENANFDVFMTNILEVVDRNTTDDTAEDEDDRDDYLPMNQYRRPDAESLGQPQPRTALKITPLKSKSNDQPDQDTYDIHFVPGKKPDSYDTATPVHDYPVDSYEMTDFSAIRKQARKGARKQYNVQAIPAVIPSERETEVCLCFDKELEGYTESNNISNISLDLHNTENRDEFIQITNVKKINPYTFVFKSKGDYAMRKAAINVYLTSGEESEEIGSCEVEFQSSQSYVVDCVNVLLMQVMDDICTNAYEMNPRVLSKLDEKLSESFPTYVDTSPIAGFENIFGIYHFLTDAESSSSESPTLIHLAAKHGLKELCAKLMDLPNANLANSIINKDHKSPSEIASNHGHKELATFLQQYTEMQSDVLYVIMNDGYLLPTGQQYYNNRFKHPNAEQALYYVGGKTSRFPQQIYTDPDIKDQNEVDQDPYMDMKQSQRTITFPKEQRKPQPKPPNTSTPET